MKMSTVFRAELIQIGTQNKTKDAILREIARLAMRSNVMAGHSEEEVFQALSAREQIGTTGFGGGIAIPHCSLDKMKDFVVGMLVDPEGIQFEAVDGQEVFLFVFIVGPKTERSRHIQLLSSVSKLLRDRETVERLLKAEEPSQVLSVVEDVSDELEVGVETPVKGEQCLFQVFIQREEYFDEILQIFTATAEGAAMIIEAQNAGAYLHRLPLFSAFWTEQPAGYGKVVMAVVAKGACNDIIRRINLIVNDINSKPGVLISVQDLMYTSGSLEFS